MTDPRLSKVTILIQQKKYAEAEQLLKDFLSTDASNVSYLTLLAEVNLQQNKLDNARSIISNAIGISPDSPHLFYIKSRIAIQEDKYDEAEKDLAHSLELDPNDADYFALWASIKLSRKQYDAALELANKSLAIDSENLLGLNIRSSALLKLNKSEESFATIEGALREDPNNAYTHANYGWGLLEKGQHKKAMEHFKESLKNDPNFTYAQAGMIEALKATNPIYKLFLKYAFWIGNLTSKYQWAVIIGFWFGVKALKAIAKSSETLQPYLTPLIIALGIVAFSTWVISPISNLFLRFNRYGKFLLDKNEKMSSNFVAASFGIFLIGLACYFMLGDDKFIAVAVFGFTMMVPFGSMFARAKNKNVLLIYAVVMAIVGLGAIGVTFSTGQLFNGLTTIYIIGFVGFQWVANYFLIKDSNR